jgi:pyruvate ferredoxin oxidoreductase gamma subunit
MTGNLKLESVQAAYNEAFSGKIAEANSQVATLAYEFLTQTK